MTTTQICALIVLIFSAGLLYLIGYRCGLSDGQKHQPDARTRRKAA